jgi:probable HAF family extracellular repeat protein
MAAAVALAAVLALAGSQCAAQSDMVTPTTTYTFTTFQPTEPYCGPFAVTGIDNKGDVVGNYLLGEIVANKCTGYFAGFERSAKGTTRTLFDSMTSNTYAEGINSKGSEIVGSVCTQNGNGIVTPPVQRRGGVCENTDGFLYQNSAFTEYVFQLHGVNEANTAIAAINDNGLFVGSFGDPVKGIPITGFVSNGNTISYKNRDTALTAINNAGTIIGGTVTEGANVSFKANSSGTITKTFAFPGAASTTATGINNSGVVVGSFVDSAGLTHGFTYQNGAYTQIDAPDGLGATTCFAINDSGSIAGTYLDSSNTEWGFIATP